MTATRFTVGRIVEYRGDHDAILYGSHHIITHTLDTPQGEKISMVDGEGKRTWAWASELEKVLVQLKCRCDTCYSKR